MTSSRFEGVSPEGLIAILLGLIAFIVGWTLLVAWGVQTVANEAFGQDWSYPLALLTTVILNIFLSALRSRK